MISQQEAERLMSVVKIAGDNETYQFPAPGYRIEVPILSFNGEEEFLLDLHRARVMLTKCTYQERYRKSIILVRLDLGGRPHTNPTSDSPPLQYLVPYNGQRIECPHLHLYVEGYHDKWAIPANKTDFNNTKDLEETLQDFMRYCNISTPPRIQGCLVI